MYRDTDTQICRYADIEIDKFTDIEIHRYADIMTSLAGVPHSDILVELH